MSDQSPTPIFDLGTSLAKAEAKKLAPSDRDTTIEFSGDVGPEKRVGVQVTHTHVGERLTFSLAGWLEQKFQPDGLSGGVKGKVSF